jgi:membrane fusion protein (multidrug efflux system)
VGQAKARLVEAERAYQRYKALNDKGFASRAQLEGYEATWRSAQADVAAAEARQNDRMIRAPFSGVVGLSDIAPGSLVNPGAPIVTLDDLSTMRVDFQVPERYLGQLSQGQAITASRRRLSGRADPRAASPCSTPVSTNAPAPSPRAPNSPIPTAS